MWIPIRVKDNNRIGLLQIQAQTTSSGREQEAENIRVLSMESLQHVAALISLGAAVQSQVLYALVVEVVLHDSHQTRHLAKHEHTMVGGLQLWQNTIKKLKFAASPEDVRASNQAIFVAQMNGQFLFNVLENEGVVTDLSQLHDCVHESLGATLASCLVSQNDTP